MIHQQDDSIVVTTQCDQADQVFACCDCLGLFPMRPVGQQQWRVALKLPPGRHHIRYYARRGLGMIMHEQEELDVPEPHDRLQAMARPHDSAAARLAGTAADQADAAVPVSKLG